MSFDFRRSPAIVLAPPMVLVTFFFLSGAAGGPAYYGLSQLAQAASAVAVIAPICAGLAAWEGARLRRGGVARLAPARCEGRLLLRALVPTSVAAAVALTFGFGVMLLSGPSLRASDSVVVLMAAGVLAGHAVLAYAAGRRLPALMAVPGAVVLSWLWIVYPIAVSPLWVRHMTGYLSTCCDASDRLAPAAALAPLLPSAGAILASAILLSSVAPAIRRLAAALALAAGFAVAALVASGLGVAPTVARGTADLVCRDGTPRVCLWTEHRGVLPRVQATASAIGSRLRAHGLTTPPVVTEARGRHSGAWRVGVTPTASELDIERILLQALVPSLPACARLHAYPGYAAFGAVALWLAELAAHDVPPYIEGATPEDRREVAAVGKLAPPAQRAWYSENLAALQTCERPPQLLTVKL